MSNDNTNGAASAAKKAIVNFGGLKTVAGRDYVYSLTDIIFTPGVIEYPEAFRFDDEKKPRTIDSLTDMERELFLKAPPVAMTRKDGSEVVGQDGKPIMKQKAYDQIRFIFTNDENGSSTGPYDFLFKCYGGKIENDPYVPAFRAQKDFKAFLQQTKGIDPETLAGNKSLWDIYTVGDKFVIPTKAELRNEKYVQLDTAAIKPYVEGMTLSTSPIDLTKLATEKLLEVLTANSGKITTNQIMSEEIASQVGAPKETIVAAFKELRADGKIVVEGGFVVVKA